MRKKSKRFSVILLVLLTALCACDRTTQAPGLPVLDAVDWMRAPRQGNVVLPLYFYGEDGAALFENRSVSLLPGETRGEVAARALFSGNEEGTNVVPFIASQRNVYPQSVQVSGNTANVNLSSDGGSVDTATLLKARVPVANMLNDLLGVTYVNIFYNNKAMEDYNGLLLGAMKRYDGTPDEYLERVKQQSGQARIYPMTLNVTLYFPDKTGQYLVCETRPIEINDSSSGAQRAVIRELLKGPADPVLQGIVNPLSAGLPSFEVVSVPLLTDERVLASNTPDITPDTEDEDSEDLAKSPFYKPGLRVWIDANPNAPILSSAAVACSLMGFMADIDGVSVNFGSDMSLESAYILRTDFDDKIGHMVTLYRQSSEIRLEKTTIVLQAERCEDPMAIATALFAQRDDGFRDAVLDAFISEETAVINIDARGFQVWQNMESNQQRMWLYSIVNTMAEINGVKRVQILVDGQVVENVGELVLESPLLPSPGLIA